MKKLRRVLVRFDNDGDGHFDESSRYSDDGEYYYADDVDTRIAELEKALSSCVAMMEIQEGRETGDMHISQEAFRPLWDEAKAKARSLMENRSDG